MFKVDTEYNPPFLFFRRRNSDSSAAHATVHLLSEMETGFRVTGSTILSRSSHSKIKSKTHLHSAVCRMRIGESEAHRLLTFIIMSVSK